MTTYWLSKYALTTGIEESRVVSTSSIRKGYVLLVATHVAMKIGVDAHETREGALKAAEQMRLRKIASLKKQIAKLEAMRFE